MADQDQDKGNDKPQFQKVKKQWIEQPPILDQRCKEQEQFKLQQEQAQLIEWQEQLQQQQSLMRQRVQQVQPVMPDIQQVPNINFYSTIGALSEFQIGEDWDLYQTRLGQYFITNQVSQDRKVAVLITLIGQEAYNILKDLCDPALPEAKPYEELCDILKKQFAPRVSVFKERIEFYELRQNEKETVNEWFARIKSKASNCKFGAQLDNNIKDRFVAGLRKGPILNRVCEEEHTVTLNSILEVARKKEMERQDGRDAADQNFDYFFKLLIIGNSSVGKTSFLFRYKDDSFTSDFQPTVGIDFTVKTVLRHDKRIKLQIWDTAGRKRYKAVTKTYYRGAMGFILMYDITNEESFNSVQDWVTQIKYYSCDNAQVILVGNKCDMEEERVISTESGKLLAEQLGVRFFETSAKENINVKAMFEQLVDIICDKMSESVDNESTLMGAGGTDQTKGQRLSVQPTNPANANVMYCNC